MFQGPALIGASTTLNLLTHVVHKGEDFITAIADIVIHGGFGGPPAEEPAEFFRDVQGERNAREKTLAECSVWSSATSTGRWTSGAAGSTFIPNRRMPWVRGRRASAFRVALSFWVYVTGSPE